MPPELPPQPPENESLTSRGIAIALLGYLRLMFDIRKKHDVLLHAPVSTHKNRALNSMIILHPAETKELYVLIRDFLDTPIESSPASLTWLTRLSQMLEKHPKRTNLMPLLIELLDILMFDKKKPSDAYEFIKNDIKERGFIDKSGYDSVVRGLNNETLALIDSTSKNSPLYLGMPVRFEKQSSVSNPIIGGPFTGDLTGEGKIFAFHIPTIGPITDRVIEVAGTHNDAPFRTLLAPDEVFTE